MRRFLLTIVASIVLVLPVRADEAAIRGVISGQIEAFLADDVERAFTFASPSIQALFGNPQNFGIMVQRGYPMVWRPDDVAFLEAEPRGAAILQTVQIIDRDGMLHLLEYQMIESGSGWRINGVRILESPAGTV